jgi:hypothetical protein
MTLKKYLEEQIRCWSKAKQEARFDTDAYWRADGTIMAYTDLILTCSDDILRKKITNEVW